MNRIFHPILFATYPVLALYALNTALVPPSDVPVPLVATIVVVSIFWGILALILRSPARAAVAASLGVLTLYSYGHIWNRCMRSRAVWDFFGDREGMLWAWIAVFISVVVLGGWKWKTTESLTRAMNFFGLVLLVMPVGSISLSWFNVWRGTLVQTASSGVSHLNITDRPDIYYIILDG